MNDSRTTPETTAGLVASGDQNARAVIDAAGGLLRAESNDVPTGLLGLLFGRAAPEDVVGYQPAELAKLATAAWAFLGHRKPGERKVRFESAPASAGERLKSISVIEMVNDDMPFLVDSIMGELVERGLEIRLVAHPIFVVERDAGGKLTGLPVQGRAKDGGRRESFIHIHVERVDDAARRAEVV